MSTAYSATVSGSLAGAVLVITLDHPPVNAVSADMRRGLLAALEAAAGDDRIAAVVLTGAGANFVAGADIREMGVAPAPPHLPDVLERIERSAKPVVAALQGATLGGGCEIALAAHVRLAAANTQIGLPEVKLGIVPGAGGTQRLPRLVGIAAALDLITSGRSVTAVQALELGLIDGIAAPGELVAEACAMALALAGQPLRRTGELTVPAGPEAPQLKLRSTAQREAARLIRDFAPGPLAVGLAEERATFLRLRDSAEAQALRHLFFAERAAAKAPILEGVRPQTIQTLGIVGAGLMGCGIAVAALEAGLTVTVVDATPEAAARGQQRIAEMLARRNGAALISALTVSADLHSLSTADAVIEAIPDDLALKQALFARLAAVVRADCVLATNTSYLNPDEIAAAVTNPERVIGLHFFSPAHVMRLVEVVRCAGSGPAAIATGFALARRMKKLPVLCTVTEGFAGNRVFSATRRQAEFLVEDGALPAEVDDAMERAGFALGPFAVFDLAGLEIAWARRKRQAATRDPAQRYSEIADQLCALGRFGQKTAKGWYRYEDGKRVPDPEVTALIEAASRAKGIARRRFGADQIVQTLLDVMASEGARLVGEAVVARPSDVDLVLVNGYGFPAARGGPMYAADLSGLAKLEGRLGADAAPLLRELVAAGRTFASLNGGEASDWRTQLMRPR